MAKAHLAAYAILGCILGIVFAGSTSPMAWSVAGITSLAFLTILTRHWRLFGAITLGLFFGAAYYISFFTWREEKLILPFETTFEGVVASEPKNGETASRFYVKLLPPYRGRVLVLGGPAEFRYGDKLSLKGEVEPRINRRDSPILKFPEAEKIGEGGGNPVQTRLIRVKQALMSPFGKYLDGRDKAAFLAGLTLGDTSGFTKEMLEVFQKSGATHLVALSGYNISLISVTLFDLLLLLLRRRVALICTLTTLAAFTLMVGLSPSVTRATIMGILLLAAKESGRFYSLNFAILWAAFLMLLLDPGSIFDVGFQLSFVSLLGVTYLAPALYAAPDPGSSDISSLRETFRMTTAAQLAVLPIVLSQFGRFPIMAIPANLAVLPLIPLTMLGGFLLSIGSFILQPLAAIIAFPERLLLGYELGTLRFFASIPVSLELDLSFFGAAICYLALGVIVLHSYDRRTASI